MSNTPADEAVYDHVVVGAGAAGCVIANRLSEHPHVRVLLLEAGDDQLPGREDPEIRDPFPTSVYNPAFAWSGLIAETGADIGLGRPRTSRPFLQGIGVGGSSNINGMNVLRGHPDDYNEWEAGGARGWAWNDVVPYFRKLEHDLDFAGPLNGRDGPMPMRRIAPADWAPFAKAMGAAMKARGFALLDDYNAEFGDGVAALPISSLPTRRVSAATAYLSDPVRARANLQIRTRVEVDRITFEERRATGVVARAQGSERVFKGRNIVLACGGIFSPAVLMRSGVGPGAQLRGLNISVVADLMGVGQNLQNHPTLNVTSYLPLASMQALTMRAVAQNCLRFSSGRADCAPHDMGLVVFNRAAWHPLGRRIGSTGVSVYRPYSIGEITLASADPEVRPRVKFNTLDDPRDFERLVTGLRLVLDLMTDPTVERVRSESFLPNPQIVSQLGKRTAWNWARTLFVAAVLDIGAARRALLKDSLLDLKALGASETALAAYVRERVGLTHHVCGTCRMGGDEDRRAVVTPRGRVRGLEGLYVADPSIFPVIPRGGMHIQAIMGAEKIADHIKQERRS